MPRSRSWASDAIARIDSDVQRSADTHLVSFPLPPSWGTELYLKDESTHPSGSLKHRLARSLFLYALCNGWLDEHTTVVEASSGSTAVSEAYFARLIGLPFLAVMPRATSPEKIAMIEHYGGRCHLVEDPTTVYDVSRSIAAECAGHFMDQFTYAERATDWRGNNNIAESIFEQLSAEAHPVPRWVVVGAGTGGTSATIGRYVRFRRHATHVCVVDPEGSAFADYYDHGDAERRAPGSRIEGIGRPRVEPSFVASVVDRMQRVPDAASFAAMRVLSEGLARRVGGSTGTGFYGSLALMAEMVEADQPGSVVTLICDGGERYADTYYNDRWLDAQGIDIAPYRAQIVTFLETGAWEPPWLHGC
jgi:cysteine synthase A